MRSYLASHSGRLNRVAFFCTMTGSGERRTFREMTKLCGHGALADLALTDAEIDHELHHAKLDRFVRTLREQTAQARANGSAALLVSERI